MLSAASEKLQINFRRSLWSSMLTNVTMQPGDRRSGGNHVRDIQNQKENPP
jgi:hypothetical protein